MSLKNKKIVMLVSNDFTHDSRVLKEALSAARAGMKVWVLARKSTGTKSKERQDGITVIRVQTITDRLGAKVLPSKGKEIGGSQSVGAKIPQLLQVYLNLLNLWLINHLFIKEAKKIKPDLVHANDTTTLSAAFRLKKYGYKIVYDAHELYSESVVKPHWVWKKIFVYLEKGLKKVDGIFSVCQPILDELDKRYGTHNVPKTILYNAPLYYKNSYRKTKKPVKMLYVGNYSKTRDFRPLLRAMKVLRGVTLTNIGPGWGKSNDPKIINLPPVTPEQIVKTITDYDIGIIPYIGDSLNHRYSTPNKLFEYMMAGLAVAASNLPEIRRITRNVENGVLFNPRSSVSIAKAVKGLMKDFNTLDQYKKNSLKAASFYSWQTQEKKQLKLYRQVLD